MNANPFVAPLPLGRLLSRLPQYPPSAAFVIAVNSMMGDSLRIPAPLFGKLLCIQVMDLGLDLRFFAGPRGFRATWRRGMPVLTISATAHDFFRLALRQEDPDTLFFNRRLTIEGDTELGVLVKNTLDSLEPQRLDFASVLSHLPSAALEIFRSFRPG